MRRDEHTKTQDPRGTWAHARLGHLVPRRPVHWFALAATLASVALVCVLVWDALVVLMGSWPYVLGLSAASFAWVTLRARRTRRADALIIEALERASDPLTLTELATLLAQKGVSPELVPAQLTELVSSGAVLTRSCGAWMGYTLPSKLPPSELA